jgi:ribosome-associated protein
MVPLREDLMNDLTFKTSRSGGKGGQNVNKVSSKVELIFNIPTAACFTDEQRVLLLERLAPRLDKDGNLHIISREDRSQYINKENTIYKLLKLLSSALHVAKIRKPTKIPRSVIKKRLATKQSIGFKKQLRKRPELD